MKAHLTRRYHFAASHRLHLPDASFAENQQIYGKCNNPHGHGHNYTVEVTVSGAVDQATGMVCNLADLDNFTHREILERFDHMNLNVLSDFAEQVPTTERLCVAIFDIYKAGFKHAHLEKLRIEETAKNSFEYTGTR
jgi:6-pyruvoyltetrahydropterin/6-carboxytetrahydropterin synthase